MVPVCLKCGACACEHCVKEGQGKCRSCGKELEVVHLASQGEARRLASQRKEVK